MPDLIGRTRNILEAPAHAIYTINSVTATKIADINSMRQYFVATLYPGITDEDVFIRYYPAATDNLLLGVDVLTRRLTGNDDLFHPRHDMKESSIYLGEISAMTLAGTAQLLVVEG